MTKPTITDAKGICTKYRRRGVVILSFGEFDYHAASYGFTRAACNDMRHVVEQIAGLIDAEVLEIPESCERFDPIAEAGE